jgi:hypothetical protein
MSDFSSTVKPLTIARARVATIDEARNALNPFDKYYGIEQTRDIKKINSFIVLPTTTIPYASETAQLYRLMFQFNVTSPLDFYILNSGNESFMQQISSSVICVKYRVGTTVFRYDISSPSGLNKQLAGDNLLQFPAYSNQIIKKNCVFEVWRINYQTGFLEAGIVADAYIKTSLIQDPSAPEDTQINLSQGNNLKTLVDIGIALPEVLPYNQPTIVWNNN